ncbi:hypothetical protein OIO90_002815 [Microbotryomycetes sp. JL221]|nr:hypothetical protein OIO90_002815 [Microbotryomycetes sp. JL221]
MASEVLPPQLSAYKPSQNERDMSKHLFDKADTDQLGVLTGDKAVPFFQHSSLSPNVLAQVWQLSDPENTGFLTTERFGVALRLIGHLQHMPGVGPNTQVKEQLIGQAGPFPRFNGFPIPTHLGQGAQSTSGGTTSNLQQSAPTTIAATSTANPLQPQTTGNNNNNSLAGNTVTPEEKAKYAKLFANSGPTNGLLDGDKARDIFIKSKLPFDTLGQIWNLADTRSRGALDVTDFTIGMHLIQHTMNGTLSALSTVLNPALYASAASLPLPPAAGPATAVPGSPATASRFGAIPGVMPGTPTRQSSLGVQPPGYLSPNASNSSSTGTNVPWDITTQEKQESDGYFDGLDVTKKGTIEGEAAVGFFMQSGLPMDVLARVWDLADIRQSGSLNKDEFAVALKLIRDRVSGKELPQTLPVNLTPPSLRQGGGSGSQIQRDLLDLMDDDGPAPTTTTLAPSAKPVVAQSTGGGGTVTPVQRALSPQSTGVATPTYGLQGTIFPQATGTSQTTLSPQATGSGFGNNFNPGLAAGAGIVAGAGLSAAAVGSRSMSGSSSNTVPVGHVAATTTSANFFDENDDDDKRTQLSADTTQLKSLQREHDTITESTSKLNVERVDLEKALSETTTQINELQTRLATARSNHEQEKQLVEDLRRKNEEQKQMLTRARTELITAESDLSALRVEKTEIEGNFLRDKEDVRDMKKKMAEVAAETKTLRDMLDKLKKDARQQKGLVAISKKQLATAESDKDKTEQELQSVEKSGGVLTTIDQQDDVDSPFDFPATSSTAASVAPALASTAPAALAASLPLPNSPAVTSPATSVRSTNPFDRMNRNLSPQVTGADQQTTSSSNGGLSLPTAAAAAVGTGAVAAASAAAAGMAGMFGMGSNKVKDEPIEGDKSDEKTTSREPELDPFGVPVSQTSTDTVKAPTMTTAGANDGPSAFDAAFDDGFGDDFASSNNVEGVNAAAVDDKAFDDAFGTQSNANTGPETNFLGVSDQDKQGEQRVIENPAQQEPTRPDEPKVPEGLGEISAPAMTNESAVPRYNIFNPPTASSANLSTTGTAAAAATTGGVTGIAAASAAREDDDQDSSDDEDEIEDAGPSNYSGNRAIEPIEAASSDPTLTGAGLSQQETLPTTSTSDSGDSFVHVPSTTTADDDVTAKFPTVEEASTTPFGEDSTLAPEHVATEPRTQSPTSDTDNFTDATAGDEDNIPTSLTAAADVTPASAESVTTPRFAGAEEASTPVATDVGTGFAAATLPTPPASHRRAPPPPPSAKSSLSLPPPVGASGSANLSTAAPAFDDSFGSTPLDSTRNDSTQAASQGVDDFDAAFADMETTGTSTHATGATVPTASKPFDDSFDTFDNDPDFDFKPDFEQPTSTTTATGGGDTTFDDDFATFDESFNPASSARQQEGITSATTQDDGEDDDAPAVKQITAMGFSRGQAVQALEKSNFDVNQAINSLL